jgi:hypothetical protein
MLENISKGSLTLKMLNTFIQNGLIHLSIWTKPFFILRGNFQNTVKPVN